jgi:transcriptional regulator with XRE-family HTH domain
MTAMKHDEGQSHLGTLIRKRRRELGLTQVELAKRIDKSPSYISSLESGSVAPSLAALRHIAQALDTVLGYFFSAPGNGKLPAENTPDKENPVQIRVVRPTTRKVLIDPNMGNVRWELLSPDLQRQMEVVYMTLEPGAIVGEEEWLIHAGEECGIVLEGALDVEFEHETFTLSSGDSLYFPSTQPHRIRNRADGKTIAIWVITPPSF